VIVASAPPPIVRCATRTIAAHISARGSVGATWKLDGRLVARLHPWQGVSFLPGIAGPGRHVLSATLVFRDRPPVRVVVLRFGVCR
jgi:hypothetical protein